MDKKKHKRLESSILKPSEMKKSRMQRMLETQANPSTSIANSGGIKAKLDFRSTALPPKAMSTGIGGSGASSSAANNSIKPAFDDSWKEFGDTINLNVDTFHASLKEAVEQAKFNKISRMIVAALKSFIVGDKIQVEYRMIGSISAVIKNNGTQLNHVPLHRAFLYIICNSRSMPDDMLELFISIITSLAKQQTILDKCYITAFLHDAIGTTVGLGTANKCCWIEKPFAHELLYLILKSFGTLLPNSEMYVSCQVDGFVAPEFAPKFANRKGIKSPDDLTQLEVYVEFLKPWFDTIRGELLPKSLFKALGFLCGCDQIRHFIATRLDIWIGTQKFNKEVSELLLIIGCNLNASIPLDRDVIDIMLKLNNKNMKTKAISGPFSTSIKVACDRSINVRTIFEALVVNEIGVSQNKSPANLPTLYMLMGCQPLESARTLGICCARELIKEKKNCTRVLRGFLKELIRGFNYTKNGEFPFSVFAATFLKNVSNQALTSEGIDEELPILATEILAQVPLVTIVSLLATREHAFSQKYTAILPNGEHPEMPFEAKMSKDRFQREFITYCENVIEWLTDNKHVFIEESDFIKSFPLLLYLEKDKETYTNVEVPTVTEQDLIACYRVINECGLSEKMFTLLFGDTFCSLPAKNAIEIASLLLQRVASSLQKHSEGPLVRFKNPFEMIDRVLEITIYPSHEIPRYEELPCICVRNDFWNAWSVIMLWIAGGGSIIDQFNEIYQTYPILRYYIHTIMLQKYEFPLDFEGKNKETLVEEERILVEEEKNVVRQYERNMGRPANSLVHNSSVFVGRREFRAPLTFDDIRIFSEKYNFVSKFSSCLTPPLLTTLVSDVGALEALFAIKEMLGTDASYVSLISTESLFFTIIEYFEAGRVAKEEDGAQINIVLSALLHRMLANLQTNDDDNLLHVMITALSSSVSTQRIGAFSTFNRLFQSPDNMFDIMKVSKLSNFEQHKTKYLPQLATAVFVETRKELATHYLQFLSNNFDVNCMHEVAHQVCGSVFDNKFDLRGPLAEFFVNYIDNSIEQNQSVNIAEMPEELICIEIATSKIVVYKTVPTAIIRLLSRYPAPVPSCESDSRAFECLLELWLSAESIPRVIDRKTGSRTIFLTMAMRKNMLRSSDQRVVDAALKGLSEEDAHEFVLVSQMSNETATKVLEMSRNLDVEKISQETLCHMMLIIRGYILRGVKAGEDLYEKIKQRYEFLKSAAKEEPMIIDEVGHDGPRSFVEKVPTDGYKSKINTTRMTLEEISTWLKTHCSTKTVAPETVSFRLPMSLIQSALSEEESAKLCLNQIEPNLKFFLSNEHAFHSLIVIVDSAAQKFESVQKGLERLAVRLLKSVKPPVNVVGILQKHSSAAQKTTQNRRRIVSSVESMTFPQLNGLLMQSTDEQKRMIIEDFLVNFVHDKGIIKSADDVCNFIQMMWDVYRCETDELTMEKCTTIIWTPQITRLICVSLLDVYRRELSPMFVFHLIDSYCRVFPIASYRELFLRKNKQSMFVISENSFQSLANYFSVLASFSNEYDLNIINMMSGIESEGRVQAGYCMADKLLQTSCAHPIVAVRRSAKHLLLMLIDRLPYLSYQKGVANSMRLHSNIESRDSCIRKCEIVVDKIVEIKGDENIALSEDICEEERVKMAEKEEEEKEKTMTIGGKRPADRSGRGPPAKKGKWVSAREAALIGGVSAEETTQSDNPTIKWKETATAIAQFNSLLRDNPTILKTKLPVLANFLSTLTSMTRKELKEELRLKKVELVLNSVISLSPYLRNDEIPSIDTALSNTFEFYEKHVEAGIMSVKEQIVFAELIIKSCASYLQRSTMEARHFLQENQKIVEKVCKRCSNRFDVDMILDNCVPPPMY